MVHLEGRDRIDDDDQHDGRSQKRNRDPEEDPQRLGTVNLGCRVIQRVNVLQAGKQQDDRVRQDRPDTKDNNSEEVARNGRQPVDTLCAKQ